MKFKYTIYKKCLPVLIAFLTFTSCLQEEFDNCPVAGKVLLAPRFTMHTQKDSGGKNYVDLFGETAHKVDFYIFNNNGILVNHISKDGAFQNGYKEDVSSLPAGEYRVITWVNNQDATELNLTPEENVTHFDDFLLSLKEIRSKTIKLKPEALLYGTASFTVKENLERNNEIPVELIRDTHKIKVIIRWRDKETKDWCMDSYHADATRIYLNDNNGTLNFNNKIVGKDNWLTYIPKYFTGEALHPFQEKDGAATVATEFYTLRLIKGESNTKIDLKELQSDTTEKTVSTLELMNYIRDYFELSGQNYTQEALDRKEEYTIELLFDCSHRPLPEQSWTAVTITMEGWILVDNGIVDI